MKDSVTSKVAEPFPGSRKILDSHSDVDQILIQSVSTLLQSEKNPG